MKYALRGALFAALLCSAHATVLNFDGILVNGQPLTSGAAVPVAYGDKVTQEQMTVGNATFAYQVGMGWTPNISVSWASYTPAGALIESNIDFSARVTGTWSGAGTLDRATQFGYAEMVLAAAPGYSVLLHGFDLATEYRDDRTTRVEINNASQTVTIPSWSVWSYAPTSPLVADSIRVRWSYDAFQHGIDNISFSQLATVVGGGDTGGGENAEDPAAVPEPGTLVLAAAGFAMLASKRLRKR